MWKQWKVKYDKWWEWSLTDFKLNESKVSNRKWMDVRGKKEFIRTSEETNSFTHGILQHLLNKISDFFHPGRDYILRRFQLRHYITFLKVFPKKHVRWLLAYPRGLFVQDPFAPWIINGESESFSAVLFIVNLPVTSETTFALYIALLCAQDMKFKNLTYTAISHTFALQWNH